jgi:hypothetical protein
MAKTGDQSNTVQSQPKTSDPPDQPIELTTLTLRLPADATRRLKRIREWERRSAAQQLSLTGCD